MPSKIQLQMLDALEDKNKHLRDKLARVELESDGTRNLLHAPGGSWQQSSEVKGNERNQAKP